MNATIDISIEFREQQMDIRIPTEVTLGRLTELISEVLKATQLPKTWRLELKGKNIKMDETDLIKDLPIGNGDVFFIQPYSLKTGAEE